ncbi:MAG: Omp28-related outer membrane protein [Rikenellaceae bacterium]
MRNIQYILLLSLLAFTSSCVGQKEPASNFSVTISASQPNISVDNGESVRLSVKNHSIDVTDQAEIYYTQSGEEVLVEGGVFVATQSGEYTFGARYSGVESDGHAVVYAYTEDQLSTEFYRRNIVMKFTGTWCVNCPAMGTAITDVEHSMPNRIVEISMHCYDELTVSESTQVASDNSFSVLPITFVDMLSSTSTSSASIITSLINNSIDTNPTTAGVKIASEIDGSTLNVTVGVKSNTSNNYKIAVALVVDNYNYAQTGADDPNYKQNKVLRFYLSELYGDSLGTIAANGEIIRNYTAVLPSEALESESRVVAYVLNEVNGKYIVNNASECVIGNSIDYMYEIN